MRKLSLREQICEMLYPLVSLGIVLLCIVGILLSPYIILGFLLVYLWKKRASVIPKGDIPPDAKPASEVEIQPMMIVVRGRAYPLWPFIASLLITIVILPILVIGGLTLFAFWPVGLGLLILLWIVAFPQERR
jgi:hypothetical protein